MSRRCWLGVYALCWHQFTFPVVPHSLPRSGANINPAVSLACAITKKMSWVRCACYSVAQCLGAVTGAGMVRIMTPALFDKVRGR